MRAPSLPVTAGALSDEEAYRYATALRTDPRSVNPPGWRIDWTDGPWAITPRTGGRRVPLGAGIGGTETDGLDRLLRYSFAMSRVRFDPRGGLPPTPDEPIQTRHGPRFVTRRPIPSGGSMYPTEVYVVSTVEQRGYHYDPYRHELTDLAVPCPRPDLCAALPAGGDLPELLLVLTNRFWKNFYKYGEFAYRLGAVDTGVALGRVTRLARAVFGRVRVHTAFADEELNTCLGVDGRQESAYAVVALGPPEPERAEPVAVPAFPPGLIERSTRIKRSARFDAMHAAACRANATGAAPPKEEPVAAGSRGPVVALPRPARPDLLDPDTMLRRTSNGSLFTGGPAGPGQLSTVLSQATAAVGDLRRSTSDPLGADVALCCAVHRVETVAPGWYRYREATGELAAAGEGTGEEARVLQEALFVHTVNIELAAFTVHVTARCDYRFSGRGVRGYREQQLAVGAAVEATTLSAQAVGLGSHALLGFDTGRVDRAYGLTGTGHGVHAQVCVGVARPDLNWEVSVIPR